VNTTVEAAAIIAPSVLALAGLGVTAAAREWLGFSVSVSLRVIPASKRQPRGRVQYVQVPPAEQPEPAATSITAARRPA
jgi:hypothetical protein